MNSARDNYSTIDDNGISAQDAIGFARTQGVWIIAAIVLGAVLGYSYSLTRPKQWLATSVLQIGQIASEQTGGGELLVEPPQRALARIQLAPFKDRLLADLKLEPNEQSRAAVLVRDTLTAQILPGTDMLQVSVRGLSPADAKTTLELAQRQLEQTHHAIAEPAIASLRQQLVTLDQDIASVRARRDSLAAKNIAQVQGGAAAANSDAIVLGNLLATTEDQLLDDLKRRRDSLAMRLGPTRTFDTKPLDEIAVSPQPVSPRRAVYAALGALLGLVVGLVIGVARFSSRNRR
jgi:uncharacterized protein involved in exopolysaccharide biosynthesis